MNSGLNPLSWPLRRGAGFVLLPVVLLLTLIAAMAWLGNRETGLTSAMARGASDQDKARYAAEAGLHRTIMQMHTKGCGGSYPIILFSAMQDNAFDGGKYYAYADKLSGSPADIYSTGTYGDASITLVRKDVPMHQATATTMTLQPGSEGVDTYLISGGASSNGTEKTLIADTGPSMPLLRFDLSAIPAGAHVTSATLSAYAESASGSGPVALHRVTRDWTEAATWYSSDGAVAWTTAGGDIHANPLASTAFAGTAGWVNWDVTALADRWLKGSLPNQGVQLRAGAGVTSITFASGNAVNASQRPKLAMTFLPTCGWTPPDTTVTLKPTADTDIDKDSPSMNFGAEPDLYLSKGYEAHPLLRFDLSGIKAGSKVNSATLRLYFGALTVNASSAAKTTVNLTLNVQAVTKSWIESEATWKKRTAGNNWTTQGGDYRSTATTTYALPKNSTPGVWLEFTVTPLVQEWVDGVTTNNGLILVLPTTSTEELIFDSREAASNAPELVVTYQ